MGHRTRSTRTALAALTLVALLSAVTIVAVSARDQSNGPLNPPPPGATNTPAPRGMMGNGTHRMMGGGMMGRANLSDPYDLRFLDEMIPHHEMAIGMVRMMISQSNHPELRDLGQRIIIGQQQQIDQMLAWRQQWYANAPPLSGGMMGNGMMGSGGTGGMMGRSMMQGNFADRMFLEMMIPHHQRAIDMSNDALTNAQHPELKGLAKEIIAVQSAEITEMQGDLAAWYGITK
ncbi:MAG: DUF305 domain-containing protein [Thermomicrobiales bacterium]